MTAAAIAAAIERIGADKAEAEQELNAQIAVAATAMIEGAKPKSLAALRNQIADLNAIEAYLANAFVEQDYEEAHEGEAQARNVASPLEFEMQRLMGEYRAAINTASARGGRTQDDKGVERIGRAVKELEDRQRDAMTAKYAAERRLQLATRAREDAVRARNPVQRPAAALPPLTRFNDDDAVAYLRGQRA